MGKPVNKTLRIAAMSAGEEIGHVSGPIVTFRGNGDPLRSLVANIEPVQEGTGDPSPDNVRPISGWSAVNVWVKPTYDPTSNPTATIALGQTIYGGTLDVTNGVLTVTHQFRTHMRVGAVNTHSGNNHYWTISLSQPLSINTTAETRDNYLSNMFIGQLGVVPGNFYVTSNGGTIVLVPWSDQQAITTKEQANAWLADNPVEVCIPLATPITIPLTATEISTLQGQNNVWADSGDVDVEYIATGGEGGKLALLLRNRKELLIALRKGLSPAEVGLLGSIPSFGGFVRPGLSTDDEKEEDELI